MMSGKNKMPLNIIIDFVMLMAMALVSISGFILEITRVRDKDCVKNRVKRAKIVRFTLC